MITLTNGALVITLPPDLDWPDEFNWSPVRTKTEPSITGSLIIDTAALAGGRLITLQSTPTSGWISRADLMTLRTWADDPATALTLSLRGASRAVAFDHEKGAIEAQPVADYSDPIGTDPYTITLRFIEI